MKHLFLVLLAFTLIFFSFTAYAQVTGLQVNGSSTGFSMVSGNSISWQYNLPAADTAWLELWVDVNANSVIDETTDQLAMVFGQIDGVMNDSPFGPPDLDGTANGQIIFIQPVGLAPGTYVMRVRANGSGLDIPGTVTPLASPAHTISGKVTVPNGQSAQYILVNADREGHQNPNFWQALTDANGNYTIQTNADTAASPWKISISQSLFRFPGAIVTPGDSLVYVSTNPSGINFNVQSPAANVRGVVVNEAGNSLIDWQLWLQRSDLGVNRHASTDLQGAYNVGILSDELNGQTWFIQAGDGNPFSTATLMAQSQLPVIRTSDNFYRRLVIYNVNSQIQGQVKINGSAPGFPLQIVAWNADTAQVSAEVDPGTGNFTIGVSNRIFNYQIFPISMGTSYTMNPVVAHPGDTGVILNITTTDVEETKPDVPATFTLAQNYPNPFNPSTKISYGVPHRAYVRLAVYNLLGQEVAELVNGVVEAGYHDMQFNGTGLASGIYFYRLSAEDFVRTMKFVLVK